MGRVGRRRLIVPFYVQAYIATSLETYAQSTNTTTPAIRCLCVKSARSITHAPVTTVPFTAIPPCGVKVQISHFPSPVRAPQNVTGS